MVLMTRCKLGNHAANRFSDQWPRSFGSGRVLQQPPAHGIRHGLHMPRQRPVRETHVPTLVRLPQLHMGTDLIRLRRELKSSVDEEKYERASELRDEIRRIEGQPE